MAPYSFPLIKLKIERMYKYESYGRAFQSRIYFHIYYKFFNSFLQTIVLIVINNLRSILYLSSIQM